MDHPLAVGAGYPAVPARHVDGREAQGSIGTVDHNLAHSAARDENLVRIGIDQPDPVQLGTDVDRPDSVPTEPMQLGQRLGSGLDRRDGLQNITDLDGLVDQALAEQGRDVPEHLQHALHRRHVHRVRVETGHDVVSVGSQGAHQHERVRVELERLLGRLGVVGRHEPAGRIPGVEGVLGARGVQDQAGAQLARLHGVGADAANVLQAGVLKGDLADGLMLDARQEVGDARLLVDGDPDRDRGYHGALDEVGSGDGGVAASQGLAKDHVVVAGGVRLGGVTLVRQRWELDRRGSLQLLAPISLAGTLLDLGEEPDEVLKLGRPLGGKAIVGPVDPLNHQRHRPAIIQRMMHGQDKVDLVSALNQTVPHKRLAQVHGLLPVCLQIRLDRRARSPLDRLPDDHLLKTTPGDLDDTGPEDGRVPGSRLEGILQSSCFGHVCEPEHTLSNRSARVDILDLGLFDAAVFACGSSRLFGGPRLFDQRERGDVVRLGAHQAPPIDDRNGSHVHKRMVVKDLGHSEGDAVGPRSRDELHRPQRISTDPKEAVLQTNLDIRLEYPRPERPEGPLQVVQGPRGLGCQQSQLCNLLARHGAAQRLELFSVDLCRSKHRHLLERNVRGGDHVAWEFLAEQVVHVGHYGGELGAELDDLVDADLVVLDLLLGLGPVDDRLLVHEDDQRRLRAARTDDFGCDLDAGREVLAEVVLDLGQLDPLPAQLDLLVLPPDEHNVAVGVVLYEVAGLVQQTPATFGPGMSLGQPNGVSDEDLGRLFRLAEVAEAHDRALDQQFADGAYRHEPVVVVGVDDPSDAALALPDGRVLGRDLVVDGAAYRALGRSVRDDDLGQPTPGRRITGADRLAPQAQDVERAHDPLRIFQHAGHAGRHVSHVGAACQDGRAEVVDPAGLTRHADGASLHQRAQHAVDADVERVAGKLKDAAALAVAHRLRPRYGARHKVGVAANDPLGHSRAARGENDVHGAVGRHHREEPHRGPDPPAGVFQRRVVRRHENHGGLLSSGLVLGVGILGDAGRQVGLQLGADDRLGTRLRCDGPESRLWLCGVGQDERGSGLENSKQCRSGPAGLFKHEHDNVSDPHASPRAQLAGYRVTQALEFAICKLAIPCLYCNFIWSHDASFRDEVVYASINLWWHGRIPEPDLVQVFVGGTNEVPD
ncbi:hypothetical protein PpBr36_00634 [Pyricularia pennisetigena]|uniref:hypothetical protein n=1 Tax=Pyricularia pennisetigena TaxID=1578925 RepID=UPI0011534515|nr:hypothetical protein PpBr36_00634 [Pyricularia pennisetigena]TLS28732.1 hypothetical protein PpBr36_00634 [Pyricularia pennisetigena]